MHTDYHLSIHSCITLTDAQHAADATLTQAQRTHDAHAADATLTHHTPKSLFTTQTILLTTPFLYTPPRLLTSIFSPPSLFCFVGLLPTSLPQQANSYNTNMYFAVLALSPLLDLSLVLLDPILGMHLAPVPPILFFVT